MAISQGNVLSFGKHLFLAFVIYCFLILCLGYEFGSGDQTEIIPLLSENLKAGYFNKDFFVTNYLDHGHSVREGMIVTSDFGLRLMPLSWWYFILHLTCGMIMITGAMAILQQFTKNKALVVATICLVWGLMFGINLGSNEIYYAQLLPSVLAKCFLIWALYFFIRNRITIWPLFVIVGSFWQDMAALQMLVILTASSFLIFLKPLFQKEKIYTLLKQVSWISMLIFATYLAIFIYIKKDLFISGGADQDDSFFKILLWRVGHHFDPTLFPLKNYIILGVIFIPGLLILYQKNFRLFIFCLLAILGCLFYAFTYQVIPQMMLTQWFKTTIWVKLICFSAVFIFVMEFVFKLIGKSRKLNVQAGLLTAVLILGIYKGPLHHLAYQLPFTHPIPDDEVKIAQLAAEITPKDALFLIPPDNSTFKINARRSCWVDYKSTVFDGTVLNEWLKRISLIYNVTLNDAGGFLAYPKMKAGYAQFIQKPQNLLNIGVTHFISEEVLPQYRLMGEKGRWRLYGVR